jgi:hypothetical protein
MCLVSTSRPFDPAVENKPGGGSSSLQFEGCCGDGAQQLPLVLKIGWSSQGLDSAWQMIQGIMRYLNAPAVSWNCCFLGFGTN